MRAVVEPLEGNKVKLSVEVEEQEFDKAIDAAFRRIAREVRIPGFRPGKAPRRLLEARLGPGVARQEALRESLPEFYARALREADVEAIAAPEIDITSGEERGPVSFDAVVEVRPQVSVVGYGGLRVTVPSPLATDADVDAHIASGAQLWLLGAAVAWALAAGGTDHPFAPWAELVTAGLWPVGPSCGQLVVAVVAPR